MEKPGKVEILFDKFGCQGAFVAIQATLALYTGGRTTGIALDSGDGVSHTVAVDEGYVIHHAISRLENAGRALTDYLLALLTERGYYFTSTVEIEIVRDIKEKPCFISKDFVADMRACAKSPTSYDRMYKLPDGQVLTVRSERFRCPEVLLRPSFLNLDGPGFQVTLYDSIMKCDVDIRRDILENVLLSGGNTLFPGIAGRLQNELQDMCSSRVRVWAPAERRYAVWLGSSILGSLSTFKEICITKSEYEDYGPKIVHRKCF
ncbi:actin-6-like [Argiope bruennichi]|uniref:actin-6-like n=1 Tax=Argiope bruennichi TaxID=94029 RepID=UPI002494B8B0|nr:actin-6-like [Argiope bruennichi]